MMQVDEFVVLNKEVILPLPMSQHPFQFLQSADRKLKL